MVDGVHEVNVDSNGKGLMPMEPYPLAVTSQKIKRGNLIRSGASYDVIVDSSAGKIKPTWDVRGTSLSLCVVV